VHTSPSYFGATNLELVFGKHPCQRQNRTFRFLT